MSRQVIPPSRPAILSPTTQALTLLQNRLHTAEVETANMVRQLTDLGFSPDPKPQPKTDCIPPADPIAPFLPAIADAEVLHKHYEALVGRLCRTESQLQTLKLNLCALQAERDLTQEATSLAARDERLQDYEEEVRTLKVEITRLRNKAEDEARNLRSALEAATTAKLELEETCKELMSSQKEINKKNSELRDELARESRLRIDLEESHGALLESIREMEGVVENERHEVKMLSTDCLELRNQGVRIQEEKRLYQARQTRFQEMTQTLQDDIDTKEIELEEATKKQKVLVSALNAIKRENEALLKEVQTSRIALEEAEEQIKQFEEERSLLLNVLTQVQSSREIFSCSQGLTKSLGPRVLAIKISEHLRKAEAERSKLQSQLSVEQRRREAAEQMSSALQRNEEELGQEQSRVESMTASQLNTAKITIQQLENKLQQEQDLSRRKENDCYLTIQECERLKGQLEVMADREQQKAASYQRRLNKAKIDEAKMATRLEGFLRSETELQATVEKLQIELGRKDSEVLALGSDRQRSQKYMRTLQQEVERLRENLETLENSQLRSRHSDLDKTSNESKKLGLPVANMLESRDTLQARVKQLESELEKSNENYRILKETREAERTTLQNQLQASEAHLESLQQQMARKRDALTQNATKEVRQLQRLNEDLSSRLKDSVKINAQLRGKLASLEETCNKQKDRIRSQKMQLEASGKLRKTNQEMTHKISDISDQLSEMERTKREYALRNSEQAKTIASFVKQVAGLQADMQALTSNQESLSSKARKKNQEMAKEQNKLQETTNNLQEAMMRLQQEKTDADIKLLEASNESVQITANLQEAQSLFKTQYHSLQRELQENRRRQAELEKTNAEQEQQLVQERTKAAEQAAKSRNMIRASRRALSHLARQTEADHKMTRTQMETMLQRLEAEKDHSAFTDNKLQRFMDISGQYIEELAMDLDRHRHQLAEATS